MNIRQYLNFQDGYYRINREERNLAAIFYHTLLLGDNLKRFLEFLKCDFPIKEKETAIYFEYAFLRDLWNSIKKDNKEEKNRFKRKLILDLLNPANRDELEKMSIYEFNSYFGAVRTLSSDSIVSPGNWSIKYYDKNITDNDEFLKICKFKWSFNAKPDVVIHTTNDTAICIEAKYESGEGKYPSNRDEREIFKRRFGQNRSEDSYLVGQLSIQKKIMEELLGIKTLFLFLVQKKGNNSEPAIQTITWNEAFQNLDTENCPYFVKEWINRPELIT